MKKLFTLIAMVAITLMSYAQNQVFWSNGEILFATPVKGIDSLNYVLDNSVASDTLQLILPHRLVEKPVNAKAFNQTFTGEGSWDFFATEGIYYNQVHVNVDLTDMKAAHKGELDAKDETIDAKEKEILAKDSTISAKDVEIKNLNDTILKRENTIGEKETIIAEQKEEIDSIIGKYSKYNTGEFTITENGSYPFNVNDFTVVVEVDPDTVLVEVHDTTTITVEVEKIVEVQVPVYNCVGGLGYVDLGLPSGTLWASANVGAENPWEFGEYYAWAEIEEKVEYTIENYAPFQNLGENIKEQLKDAMMDAIFSGSMSDIIKDLISGSLKPGNNGNVDFSSITDLLSNLPEIAGDLANVLKDVVGGLTEETELIAFKDAARMSLGKKWCMPTKEQLQELLDNCEWTYGKMEGVDGWTVTGSNGNSIFLPAAGMKKDGTLTTDGGYYWSKTGSELAAYGLTAKNINITSGGILGGLAQLPGIGNILGGLQDKLNEATRTVAPCMDLYVGKTIRPVYIGK
jgi:hypothetical protein